MTPIDLKEQLHKHFGFEEFREGQESVIKDVLAGDDVLGILPTGTGKSLCYQLPAKILGGMTIVVSPLISLMIDQVKQLKANGYKSVVALTSFMDRNEKIRVMKTLEDFSLLYLSPEMLQNEWLQDQLKKINVALFVIDEAHCISQWGHEFRTDYLKLYKTIEHLGHPPVLALSATATPEVQEDILDKLKSPQMKRRIYPMDKQNISFTVEQYDTPEEKIERIVNVLSKSKTPAMIYFSSRQWAEKVSFELQERLDHRVAFYHGGMEQTDRMLIQQQFMNDQLDVVCCTSAFGMGVDKKNIRFVIHFHLPPQLESFIQEVGRAGRDGRACASLVLFTQKDHYLPQMLIESELPDKKELVSIISKLENISEDILAEDEAMMEVLHLSESQWNFIKYHLEEEGWKKGRKIEHLPASFQQKILHVLEERWMYKQNKLTELLKWIHHTACRREELYKPFQESIRTPFVPCCDVCGFKIDDLTFGEVREQVHTETWKDRLQEIFSTWRTL